MSHKPTIFLTTSVRFAAPLGQRNTAASVDGEARVRALAGCSRTNIWKEIKDQVGRSKALNHHQYDYDMDEGSSTAHLLCCGIEGGVVRVLQTGHGDESRETGRCILNGFMSTSKSDNYDIFQPVLGHDRSLFLFFAR